MSKPQPPGFWGGVLALPLGLRFLAERRRLWPAAATPMLVLLGLVIPLAWWSIDSFG
ncbi:MAG: hypothetical protein RL685_6776, partial [Pseudomonadota bacterium]